MILFYFSATDHVNLKKKQTHHFLSDFRKLMTQICTVKINKILKRKDCVFFVRSSSV